MWCHVVLLFPLVGLGLFWVLPWPMAVAGFTVLTALAVGIALPAVRALQRPVSTGREALVGQVADAESIIDREGREGLVRHGGELWTAITRSGAIPEGTRVVIADVQGAKLVVERFLPGASSRRSVGRHE